MAFRDFNVALSEHSRMLWSVFAALTSFFFLFCSRYAQLSILTWRCCCCLFSPSFFPLVFMFFFPFPFCHFFLSFLFSLSFPFSLFCLSGQLHSVRQSWGCAWIRTEEKLCLPDPWQQSLHPVPDSSLFSLPFSSGSSALFSFLSFPPFFLSSHSSQSAHPNGRCVVRILSCVCRSYWAPIKSDGQARRKY